MLPAAPAQFAVDSCSLTSVSPIEFTVVFSWVNQADYQFVELYESETGVGWSLVMDGITDEFYEYIGVKYNTGYFYKVRGYVDLQGYSKFSDTIYYLASATEESDSVTTSDVVSEQFESATESNVSEIVTVADSVTDTENYFEPVSDTVTVSDSVQDAILERLNLARFIGSNNGKLFLYSLETHSDNGNTIPAWWESKDNDFDDQYPQFIGKYKYLHTVKLRYIDLGEHSVTVSISTNGGTTWVDNIKTIGTGSGAPKEKTFNFWLHGRTFMVRVAHASADKDFQWVDLELEFDPAGDYFEV